MGSGTSSSANHVASTLEPFSHADNVLDNRVAVPFGESGLPLNRWFWTSAEALNVKFLEREHNFIQWILPTDQRSQYNEEAPVMTDRSCREAMLWSRHRLDNVVTAAILMLSFYGWLVVFQEGQSSPLIVPGPGHAQASANVAKHRHNVLRMTRLVRSLRIFGLHSFSMQAASVLNQTLVDISAFGGSAYIMDKMPDIVFANEYIAREFRDSFDAAHAFGGVVDANGVTVNKQSFESKYFDEIGKPGFPIHEYSRVAGAIWTQ
jgi:hypothetical protein